MERKTLYELQEENVRKTYLFIAIFSILILFFISPTLSSLPLFILLAIGVFISNRYAYKNAEKILLRSVHAYPADPDEYYVLHGVVEEVALSAGIPKPEVYIMDEMQPNAFATGKDPEHAAICVTKGLLSIMNREELQGVIAHEVAHIRNNDVLLMTVIGVIAGFAFMLGNITSSISRIGNGRRRSSIMGALQLSISIIRLLYGILFPFLVMLSRAAISREREFLADATGAYIIRDPEALASALEKIKNYKKPMKKVNPAIAHIFIANPFRNRNRWFATHPPIEERIKRLRLLM
jgi:heat shock protein HtpX